MYNRIVKKGYTVDKIKSSNSTNKLESEKIILDSTLSYIGSYKRLTKKTNSINNKWLRYVIVFSLISVIWFLVTIWYFIIFVCFGILVIPFRLYRRSNKKNKIQALQHKELLEKLNENK